MTAATPGTCAIAWAAEATAGLPGGADTRARTPGLASAPVARSTRASARALAELGSLNGLRALSRPMAVAPKIPATANTTSASNRIRRGCRMARLASAASMSARLTWRRGAGGGQQHRPDLGHPVQVCLFPVHAEHGR